MLGNGNGDGDGLLKVDLREEARRRRGDLRDHRASRRSADIAQRQREAAVLVGLKAEQAQIAVDARRVLADGRDAQGEQHRARGQEDVVAGAARTTSTPSCSMMRGVGAGSVLP